MRYLAPSKRVLHSSGPDVTPIVDDCWRCKRGIVPCINEDHDLGDWGHRDHIDDPMGDVECGTLIQNLDQLPQLTRMLMESNEHYIELDKHLQIVKVIKRRADEKVQPIDLRPEREISFPIHKNPIRNLGVALAAVGFEILARNSVTASEEDAMADGCYMQLSSIETSGASVNEDNAEKGDNNEGEEIRLEREYSAPKDKWDLIYSADVDFSAPIFPEVRLKNNSSHEFRRLEVLIREKDIPKGFLYRAASMLRPGERKRIWEIFRLNKFLGNRK